jgi:TRAP-type C4-dicarboxylate transport system permease small subunit
MASILRKYEQVIKYLGKIETIFSCLLVVLMVVVVGFGVFLRYVLKSPLVAGMNMATLMLVWMTFLGASAIYKEKGHIAMEFIVDRLPNRLRKMVLVFVYITIAGVLIVTAFQATRLVSLQWKYEIVALGIPRGFLSLPVTIAAISMFFTTILHIVDALEGNRQT